MRREILVSADRVRLNKRQKSFIGISVKPRQALVLVEF